MAGETDLAQLIKGMTPSLNKGDYVFATVKDISKINRIDTICEFKEEEGVTLVIEKRKADELQLDYEYIAAWITLKIHSSLDAAGFTALFSTAMAIFSSYVCTVRFRSFNTSSQTWPSSRRPV